MPGFGDVNDLFAWVTATGNVDLLRQLQQAVNARLGDLQKAQLGGEGAQLVQPHVQPTDVMRPGPLAGQPMVGPDPQPGGGQDVQRQAKINQETEEGQRQSGARGIGPQPVAVNVGPASEQQEQQARQIVQEQQRQAKERQQREQQQLRATAQGGQGGGGQQGAQQAQQGQGAQQGQQAQQAREASQPKQGAGSGK